ILVYQDSMNRSLSSMGDQGIELDADRGTNFMVEDDDSNETEERYDNTSKKTKVLSRKFNKRTYDSFLADKDVTSVFVQNVYLEEEDLNVALYLLSRWMPKIWIWFVGDACEMGKAEWIVVENQWGELSIENVSRKYYGGTILSVFSTSQLDDDDAVKLASLSSDELLRHLHHFDYRYIRFIYNPLLGKFLQNRFSELYTSSDMLPTVNTKTNNLSVVSNVGLNCSPLLHAMATCHSLKLVDNELIGDPLDLKMFEFTNWILEESGQSASRPSSLIETTTGTSPVASSGGMVPTVVRPPGSRQFDLSDVLMNNGERNNEPNAFLEFGIIRTFEFVSSLRRMSVLVKRLRSHTIEVYVKVPENYDELLHYYTHNGFRVIACAFRSFDDLNWIKAQKIKREQVEQDLEFLGIIVFENKLKAETPPVVETLRRAKIRQVMCTGDNVLTAISVSRECGMISKNAKVYVPRFEQRSGNSDSGSSIVWQCLDDQEDLLDSRSLKPIIRSSQPFSEFPFIDPYEYDLAVTGDVFRWIVDYADEITLYRMLIKGQIFARMSPDEKHELVEKLQEIGYCVGFCGDGANDCGALKAADVGLSLSDAEASVAAPFTSRNKDIGCVVEIIK
ncbi:3122_t:CDS:10, partial [Acaulospora colombiana]